MSFFSPVTPFDVVKVRLQAQQRAELARKCFLYCNGLMDHICKCAETLSVHPQESPWYNRPVPVQLNGTLVRQLTSWSSLCFYDLADFLLIGKHIKSKISHKNSLLY